MIEEAVYSIGTAHAGLAGLIEGRLYPVAEEREHAAPRVVYEKDTPEPVETVWLDSGWYHTLFAFRAYAATAKEAKEVIEQVRAAYQRYHGSVAGHAVDDVRATGDTDEGFEYELGLFYEELELEFFHN